MLLMGDFLLNDYFSSNILNIVHCINTAFNICICINVYKMCRNLKQTILEKDLNPTLFIN